MVNLVKKLSFNGLSMAAQHFLGVFIMYLSTANLVYLIAYGNKRFSLLLITFSVACLLFLVKIWAAKAFGFTTILFHSLWVYT